MTFLSSKLSKGYFPISSRVKATTVIKMEITYKALKNLALQFLCDLSPVPK